MKSTECVSFKKTGSVLETKEHGFLINPYQGKSKRMQMNGFKLKL
jgi:hypothetical protein